jgi:cytochrome c
MLENQVMRRKSLLPAALLALLSALAAAGAAQHVGQRLPERPRDPWVFRCVLDERPRVVVIALHEDLYVAYDTTDCSLYKAWQGDVKFDGAVYTTVHGPQPTSRGVDYIVKHDEKPWLLRRAGKAQEHPAPQWLGYRFIGGQVHLRYRVTFDDTSVVIVEVPEARLMGEEMTFERTIRVEGLPNTTFLGASIPLVDSADNVLRQFINGRPMRPKPDDARKAVHLPVAQGETKIVVYMPKVDELDAPDQAKDE